MSEKWKSKVLSECFNAISVSIQELLSVLDAKTEQDTLHRTYTHTISIEQLLKNAERYSREMNVDFTSSLGRAHKIVNEIRRSRSISKARQHVVELSGIINGKVLTLETYRVKGLPRTFTTTITFPLNKKTKKEPLRALNLLKAFAWICGKENREHLEMIIVDLKKDILQMQSEKYSERFIKRVVRWHIFVGAILPIVWDGFRRFVGAVLPVGKIIRKLIGL